MELPATSDSELRHNTHGPFGSRLHYVTCGSGHPILLVAGWPQSWFAWRKMIRPLAKTFRVVAVDLPGLGGSDRSHAGYDAISISKRLRAFVQDQKLEGGHYIGHDIGAWLGYTYARLFPKDMSSLTLIDATVPGLTPADAYELDPERLHKNWHFFFNALPDLPEALVAGRERQWLSWLFKTKSRIPNAIESEALDEYTRCYEVPGALTGGFGYYRDLFATMAQNRELAVDKITCPVLAVGGSDGAGNLLEKIMSAHAVDVRGYVISGCGHYVPEEAPSQLLELLHAFLPPTSSKRR